MADNNQNTGAPKIIVQEEPLAMWQLIEVPVTSNGLQKIPLPDVQQLRSMETQTIIIKGIRLVSPKVLTNAVLQNGTNAPLAELKKMSLVLYSMGWQRGQLMPVLMLNDEYDADAATATTIPFRTQTTKLDNWRNVDWPQSFLQFSNGTQSASTPYVVMFVVDYLKLNQEGQPILGAS